jgi:hypothetical protein
MELKKIAKIALMVIEFLQKLEEIVDPAEKSLIEDTILEILRQIAEKLDD